MTNANSEARLISMAAQLLGMAFQAAQAGVNDPGEIKIAETLHETEKLYPRLSITTPHGDTSKIRLDLTLCHPDTDEPVVSMLTLTGET